MDGVQGPAGGRRVARVDGHTALIEAIDLEEQNTPASKRNKNAKKTIPQGNAQAFRHRHFFRIHNHDTGHSARTNPILTPQQRRTPWRTPTPSRRPPRAPSPPSTCSAAAAAPRRSSSRCNGAESRPILDANRRLFRRIFLGWPRERWKRERGVQAGCSRRRRDGGRTAAAPGPVFQGVGEGRPTTKNGKQGQSS